MAKAAALAKKEAMGDFSHLKNKKGELIAKPLPQPTLPNLSVDDDFDDTSSMRTRGPPSTPKTQDYYEYKSEYNTDYPPMPAYNQPYPAQGGYYPSSTTFVEDEHHLQNNMIYDDDQGSTANLALAAAPFAQTGPERMGSPLANPYGAQATNGSYIADPHDVYQGRAIPNTEYARRSPQPPANEYMHSQLPYGEMQDYPSPTSGGPPAHQQQQYGSMHAPQQQQAHAIAYGGEMQSYPHPSDAYQQPPHTQDVYYANQYQHDGQGHAEQGYYAQGDNGDAGYAPHAM